VSTVEPVVMASVAISAAVQPDTADTTATDVRLTTTAFYFIICQRSRAHKNTKWTLLDACLLSVERTPQIISLVAFCCNFRRVVVP